MAGNKKNKRSSAAAPFSASDSLHYPRYKHWQYLSLFTGIWLNLSMGRLEAIEKINSNTPRPNPVHCGVVSDFIEIRKLVDEAKRLAVRASDDTVSSTLTDINDSILCQAKGKGHNQKLSKERKFRMREQAVQKLASAYRLDDAVCSVVVEYGCATTLENIASMVLRRNPANNDAKYVHFFQEKVDPRRIAELAGVEVLSEIAADLPSQPSILRSRGMAKAAFKGDLHGAIQDLTIALSQCRDSHELKDTLDCDFGNDAVVLQTKQPCSIETQLLIDRASVHFIMAVRQVRNGLDPELSTETSTLTEGLSTTSPAQREESRKLVKTYAKRAIHDFLSFFSKLDYSPNLPVKTPREFNSRICAAFQNPRLRNRRSEDTTTHRVLALSELFQPVPPKDIPVWPNLDINPEELDKYPQPELTGTCEFVTYHPVLTESLHLFLLCHAFAQTSPKELQRHAYNVSRICRIINGYPLFQDSQHSARRNFHKVLSQTGNWLDLCWTWDQLCTRAPRPMFDTQHDYRNVPKPTLEHTRSAVAVAKAIQSFEQKQKGKAANTGNPARQSEAEAMGQRVHAALERGQATGERSSDIARWILEVPRVTGTARRKKRPKKIVKDASASRDVADGVDKLQVDA